MKNYRQVIIAFFTFIGGAYFFLEFILPKKLFGFQFGYYHDEMGLGLMVLGSMAIGLGIINIFKVYGGNIIKTKKGWINSVALILGLLVMLVVDGIDLVNSEKTLRAWQGISHLGVFASKIRKDHESSLKPGAPRVELLIKELDAIHIRAEAGTGFLNTQATDKGADELATAFLADLTTARKAALALRTSYQDGETPDIVATHTESVLGALKKATASARDLASLNYENSSVRKTSHLLFEGFFVPLGSAMFSLLGFYVASAAYRSFRVKSLEAMIMMVAALVVILGQIPQGPMYVYHDLPKVRLWLLENLSTPAFRAIFFCSAIAGLALSVRMWLSLEKSPLSADDENENEKS